MLVNSLGRKWEFTFTTLVTFGGAFFASFPLFYSTSFGGAFYVWMAILLVFVIQAVAYEYRRKPGNVFGERTFNAFLLVNGVLGPLLIGTAVGTFTTGAEVGAGSSGERDSWAGSPSLCMNSSSSASAEIVSIVLETLLTAKLRSLSRANNTLLSMPIFLASSWMRMLIRWDCGLRAEVDR
jgi:cytochrome bd-type quinol oxidase subunit 2